MEVIIKGKAPLDPKQRVLAIEAATRAICEQTGQDPAEGIMMLMTAAAHLFSQYSGKTSAEGISHLAHSLGCATVAADGFFKLRAIDPSSEAEAD